MISYVRKPTRVQVLEINDQLRRSKDRQCAIILALLAKLNFCVDLSGPELVVASTAVLELSQVEVDGEKKLRLRHVPAAQQ